MAAKDEAKIKFTAETSEFNEGIKTANNALSALRGELKLQDAQMKATGATVEGLQNKQKNLTAQLEAQQDKTAALSEKVRIATELFGANSDEATKLQNQLNASQTAEIKLQSAIQECNKQLQEQIDEQNKTQTAGEKLTETISEQQDELKQLKKSYVDAVLEYGEASDEAQTLAGKIDALSGDLKENQKRMNDAETAADKLGQSVDEAGDAAKDASDGGFTVLKGAMADLASKAIQSVIGKMSEFANWLTSLPDETREFRQDISTLTTAFDEVGFSTETAKDTWKDLYAVFGEDDRAVEAANNISRMAKSQEELNDWVTITTGVWATYQDALPVEGLAEAAGETAKTGQVTGVLADALNWSSEAAVMFADYMSEDVTNAEDAFNVALSKCTTEQERQALINETLTKLYGNAADTYRDTASAQMEAKEATAEATLAEANLGEALEPVTTAWTNLRTELLTAVAPAIEKVSEVATDVLTWAKENPETMKAVAKTLGIVAAAIGVVVVAVKAATLAQTLWNIATAANPIGLIIMGVVAAIAVITAAVIAIVKHWDDITAAASKAIEGIKTAFSAMGQWIYSNVIQPVANFFTGLWQTIVNGATTAWAAISAAFSTAAQWLYDSVISPVANFFTGLWNGIVNGVTTAWTAITTVCMTVAQWFYDNVIMPIYNFFAPIVAWFTELFMSIYNTLVSVVMVIVTLITGTWEIIQLLFSVVAQWFYDNVIAPVADFFTALWSTITEAAAACWNGIVTVWTIVSTWFNDNIIVPVKQFFVDMWNGITEAAAACWNGIVGVWQAVSSWFTNSVVTPLKNGFADAWNSLKSGAANAWAGIQSVFSSVASWFEKIFTDAWTKVKNVFSTGGKIFSGIKDGIVSAFKAIVNAIIGGINRVVSVPFNAINGALSRIRNVSILGLSPFAGLPSIGVPQIPYLAEGGILTKPTLNVAGEAGDEAVIPIEKLQTYIESAIDKKVNNNNIAALIDAVSELADRAIQLNINGRQFATATASDSDNVNGSRLALQKRGLAL